MVVAGFLSVSKYCDHILVAILTFLLTYFTYRNLVLKSLLGHDASLLRLRHAHVADFLDVFSFHRSLGLHLLQLVLEMRDHLSPLLQLRFSVPFHLRDLLLQLANFLTTFLLSAGNQDSGVFIFMAPQYCGSCCRSFSTWCAIMGQYKDLLRNQNYQLF